MKFHSGSRPVKHGFAVLAMVAPLLSLVSCAEGRVAVAVMTKLDNASIVGASEMDAVKLYLAESGADSRMTIRFFDDGWNPETAVRAYRAMRAEGIEILVTSHPSNCALAIADEAVKDGVFMIVAGAATPSLTGKDDSVFRIIPDADSEQSDIAAWMNGKLPCKVVVVRDVDNLSYTEPALKRFLSLFSGKATVLDVSMGALDMEGLRKSFREKDFDCVYFLVGGYKVTVGALAQLARLEKPDCGILFSPWMKTPMLVETAGTALDAAVMPSILPSRMQDNRIYLLMRKFTERFGFVPTFLSMNVYQALEVVDAGIRAGKTKSAELSGYVRNRSIRTTLGQLTFDGSGDVARSLFFITDIRGEFE